MVSKVFEPLKFYCNEVMKIWMLDQISGSTKAGPAGPSTTDMGQCGNRDESRERVFYILMKCSISRCIFDFEKKKKTAGYRLR